MALITWDDKKYSVSVPSIDIQHKKLVDLINKLHNGMMTGTAKSLIKEIITELVDYTKTHFKYEEELLIKCGYDEFEQHKSGFFINYKIGVVCGTSLSNISVKVS